MWNPNRFVSLALSFLLLATEFWNSPLDIQFLIVSRFQNPSRAPCYDPSLDAVLAIICPCPSGWSSRSTAYSPVIFAAAPPTSPLAGSPFQFRPLTWQSAIWVWLPVLDVCYTSVALEVYFQFIWFNVGFLDVNDAKGLAQVCMPHQVWSSR